MHVRRVRPMLATLLGVFMFGAVTATAQAEEAPFWSIGGTRLEAGKTHYISTKEYNITGKTTGFTLKEEGPRRRVVHCESIRLKEGVLLGSAAGNPGKNDEIIEFFGRCTVENNGVGCKVTEPIVTTNVRSELVETEKGVSGSLLTVFKPEAGARLTTIRFEPEVNCTVKETPVEGEVVGQVRTDPNNGGEGELVKLPNEKKEAKSWLINFPEKPINEGWLIKEGAGLQVKLLDLKAFSESATLIGTALILLAKKNSKGGLESEEVNWSPLP